METKEERQKRLLATAMAVAYCTIQNINIYVSINELLVSDQLGYFICVMIILALDKAISFAVLRREKFGHEIVVLDLLNLGFISIFLKRYPPFYRPMYGAKLFCVIIPTVLLQLVFFFGLDMVDETPEETTQILMFFTYIGYQILQVRCFLALRMDAKNDLVHLTQMILIYGLNVFSNYGIWLVFASHKDTYLDISLLFYGGVLFLAMVGYQCYNLYKLKSSTLLLNFLYNVITSTNYTTEYGYYFHHYSTHFEDLYRERQTDLIVMSVYKTAQLMIFYFLGDVKHFEDKYLILDTMTNVMVVVTFLDVICNLVQYMYGVRKVFYAFKDPSLSEPKAIAQHILNVPEDRKFIYINNKSLTADDAKSGKQDVDNINNIEMVSLLDSLDSYHSSKSRSIKASHRKPLLQQKISNKIAQKLLVYLTRLQKKGGCVVVEQPKLCITSQKFDVSAYVSYAQLSVFFSSAEVVPSKTFEIQADWENIYMFRLLSRGYDASFKSSDETYSYCVCTYLDIYLPIQALNKIYPRKMFQISPARLLQDLYCDI